MLCLGQCVWRSKRHVPTKYYGELTRHESELELINSFVPPFIHSSIGCLGIFANVFLFLNMSFERTPKFWRNYGKFNMQVLTPNLGLHDSITFSKDYDDQT